MQCSCFLCVTVSASNTNSVFNIQVASLLSSKVNCLLAFSAVYWYQDMCMFVGKKDMV